MMCASVNAPLPGRKTTNPLRGTETPRFLVLVPNLVHVEKQRIPFGGLKRLRDFARSHSGQGRKTTNPLRGTETRWFKLF